MEKIDAWFFVCIVYCSAQFNQSQATHISFPVHRMSTRCSSVDSSKIAMMMNQVRQYKALLAATEKAATELRLFGAHIYEEDKAVLQAKIMKHAFAAQTLMKQCSKY
jgi:uncharacterized membrane protein affecting hemolysin expression